jgi:hypothetical protein
LEKERAMNKMYRRKNGTVEAVETDAEVQQMDVAVEEEVTGFGEKVQQVKALIPRMADLSHYLAFNDIEFIIEAIGNRDYPGSPALDVLPSYEVINSDRKEKVREYIHCLLCWAEAKDVEDAVAEFKSNEKLLRNTYIQLGELDEDKKSLALMLAKILKDQISSPEDAISEISDEDFIKYVYKTILGREPGEDDLSLRLTQLKRGKPRHEMIKDILESKESSRIMLAKIAESINQSDND